MQVWAPGAATAAQTLRGEPCAGSSSCGGRSRGWGAGAGLETRPRASENTASPPPAQESSRGGVQPPTWASGRTEGAFVRLVLVTPTAGSPVFGGSALWPAEQEDHPPPAEPQTQKGHISRTPAAPRQKGPVGKGWPSPRPRGPPPPRPDLPAAPAACGGWGGGARPRSRPWFQAALTLAAWSPPPRGISSQRSLHDALGITRPEASDHHRGHSRCSCPALNDRHFSPWLFAK